MKRGFCDDIEDLTENNQDFRRVLYTGEHLQLVLMTLQSGQEIGEEVHPDRDQFFRIEQGEGVIDIDGRENRVVDDIAVIVPAGARHNVRNTGSEPLQFYTIYGPPEHKDGISIARSRKRKSGTTPRSGTGRRPNDRHSHADGIDEHEHRHCVAPDAA